MFLVLCALVPVMATTSAPTQSAARVPTWFAYSYLCTCALLNLASLLALGINVRRRSKFPIRGRRLPVLAFLEVLIVAILFVRAWQNFSLNIPAELLFYSLMPLMFIVWMVRAWILQQSFAIAAKNKRAVLDGPDMQWVRRRLYMISPRFLAPVVVGAVLAIEAALLLVTVRFADYLFIVSGFALFAMTLCGLCIAFQLRHYSDDGFMVKSELRLVAVFTAALLLPSFVAAAFLDAQAGLMLIGLVFLTLRVGNSWLSLGLPLWVSYRTEAICRENTVPISQVLGGQQEQDFRVFLALEFSEENLDFYNEVKAFQTKMLDVAFDDQCVRDRLAQLCATYMFEMAPKQVNIGSAVRKQAAALLAVPPHQFNARAAERCLATAQAQVFALLQTDVFPRYQRSLKQAARHSTFGNIVAAPHAARWVKIESSATIKA